jgi:hypothetical protein
MSFSATYQEAKLWVQSNSVTVRRSDRRARRHLDGVATPAAQQQSAPDDRCVRRGGRSTDAQSARSPGRLVQRFLSDGLLCTTS